MSWVDAGEAAAIPARGARVLRVGGLEIAVFRTGEGRVYALRDRCPHRGGPLSQGLVHGDSVTCPLHDWVIDLRSGAAVAPDEGCAATYPVRIEAGRVHVEVPAAGKTETGDEHRSVPSQSSAASGTCLSGAGEARRPVPSQSPREPWGGEAARSEPPQEARPSPRPFESS